MEQIGKSALTFAVGRRLPLLRSRGRLDTICPEPVDRNEARSNLGQRACRIAIGTDAIARGRTSTIVGGRRLLVLVLVLVLEHSP
jgi:hypothetical protein